MLLYLLFLLYLVYAVLIVRFVNSKIDYFTRRYEMEDLSIVDKYDCYRRKDMANWNHWEMYFCAIFLLPIRMIGFIIGLLIEGLVVTLAVVGTDPKKPLSPVRLNIVRTSTQFASRYAAFLFGFCYINKVKLNIRDFDPSYPADADNNAPAPVIACNHVSWADILLHLSASWRPGFMAKAEVAKYPIVGKVAKAIGSLFVERESKTGRDDVVNKLKERLEMVRRDPEDTPRVLIFPEGTTSNGEYILSMKKGAFFQLTPIHLTAIKYHATRFNPAYDALGIGAGVLLSMCQFYNGVTMYDLGIYNPEHLNLKSEEDWPIYAEKIKNILIKVLKAKSCEMGYHDKTEYEKYLDTLSVSKAKTAGSKIGPALFNKTNNKGSKEQLTNEQDSMEIVVE